MYVKSQPTECANRKYYITEKKTERKRIAYTGINSWRTIWDDHYLRRKLVKVIIPYFLVICLMQCFCVMLSSTLNMLYSRVILRSVQYTGGRKVFFFFWLVKSSALLLSCVKHNAFILCLHYLVFQELIMILEKANRFQALSWYMNRFIQLLNITVKTLK